jgi:DNA repair protein RadC
VETDLIFPYGRKVAQVELLYKCRVKPSERPLINGSEDAFRLFLRYWNKSRIELLEEFKCMYLNKGNRVLAISELCIGGIDFSPADLRLVLAIALKLNATAFIVCHNHPSGNMVPSQADRNLTDSLTDAATLMHYTMLDHLIISREECFSFANKGLLYLHGNRKYSAN